MSASLIPLGKSVLVMLMVRNSSLNSAGIEMVFCVGFEGVKKEKRPVEADFSNGVVVGEGKPGAGETDGIVGRFRSFARSGLGARELLGGGKCVASNSEMGTPTAMGVDVPVNQLLSPPARFSSVVSPVRTISSFSVVLWRVGERVGLVEFVRVRRNGSSVVNFCRGDRSVCSSSSAFEICRSVTAAGGLVMMFSKYASFSSSSRKSSFQTFIDELRESTGPVEERVRRCAEGLGKVSMLLF